MQTIDPHTRHKEEEEEEPRMMLCMLIPNSIATTIMTNGRTSFSIKGRREGRTGREATEDTPKAQEGNPTFL